jgi:hypothetical protein
MAIIEELDENDSQSQQEFSDVTETDTAAEVNTQEAAPVEATEEEIPSKYKGKSLAEIAKMHEEAEKLIGRQANEVGELRKLTDEILKQQLANSKPKQEEQAPEVDFWSDPDTYLNKKLETHPDILAARQLQMQTKMQQTAALLQKNHPDFQEIAGSSDFQDWVAKSKVRTQLYVQADKDFDYEAADELLSTYKAINGRKAEEGQQQAKELTASRQKQLKAATVDAGGGNETSRKVYRRADLIRLKMTDPARYEALSDEIMAAYAEGRVK